MTNGMYQLLFVILRAIENVRQGDHVAMHACGVI